MFLSKKSVTFAVSALAMLCSGAAFAKEALIKFSIHSRKTANINLCLLTI
jgi:hypothetical protein